MLVKLHQEGQHAGHFSVDIRQKPSTARAEPSGEELYLEWNSTVDDSGKLRGCIACGGEVYRDRTFPQMTGIVVVLAFAGAVAGLLGLVTTWFMLVLMAIVLVLDVVILIIGHPRLVCYKCGTVYCKLDIAPYHQRWDVDRSHQLKRTT